ncbi:secondary thiamine-phosphate synthase enzyme YjbQ [Flocculibacter collagenilyticus]|uniref:secondary thiamine-phosphate synthase enzyme YjbQ n=1 Tax=Flocculibacter collagenilyticus TaxID=2744479 RepID=UPI0018F4C046|nr:secondary thiamine-phosphate synthase enzyme YjbQ [Flocculibacter collagenilyticus]
MWQQFTIQLKPRNRGFHLITEELTSTAQSALSGISVGMFHAFIQHTSASISINENADPTVRQDLEAHLNKMIPELAPYYQHTYEGPDDMPAHIKTALIGNAINIPIAEGQLLLGTWQGIYLGEHRNHGGSRRIIVTLHGE